MRLDHRTGPGLDRTSSKMASASGGGTSSAENSGKIFDKEDSVKIICLGDSAVGKSKYVLPKLCFNLV